MFAEVMLVLRHHPHFQELGSSQQQRDAPEIICTPEKPSSPRSTIAGGCWSPAMSADHQLAPALSLKPRVGVCRRAGCGCEERGGGGETAPPRVNNFHCNCVISSGTSRSFRERALKAEARGLVLIQLHAAPGAPDGRAAGLGHLGLADGWGERICVPACALLACVCVCVCV